MAVLQWTLPFPYLSTHGLALVTVADKGFTRPKALLIGDPQDVLHVASYTGAETLYKQMMHSFTLPM